MTEADWTPEEDEAFNEVEKSSNLGKQILRELGQPYVYPPKREWVGLTDEEIGEIRLKTFDAVATNHEVYQAIEAKLKEKNARAL
jgi:hypothetical protein